jgi:hypothetical protein
MQTAQKTILDDHRNMLMVSKKISDFQETNLKNWPLIVFNDVDSVKIDYNFVRKNEFFAGIITFDLSFKDNKIPDEETKKIAITNLYQWTTLLFWTDTKINFKLNGKKWT